jgi:hypothetical protein
MPLRRSGVQQEEESAPRSLTPSRPLQDAPLSDQAKRAAAQTLAQAWPQGSPYLAQRRQQEDERSGTFDRALDRLAQYFHPDLPAVPDEPPAERAAAQAPPLRLSLADLNSAIVGARREKMVRFAMEQRNLSREQAELAYDNYLAAKGW